MVWLLEGAVDKDFFLFLLFFFVFVFTVFSGRYYIMFDENETLKLMLQESGESC